MVGANLKTAETDGYGFPPSDNAPVARPRHWAILTLCALATLVLYPLLLRAASRLAETVPSHAAEVVPWAWPARPLRAEERGEGADWPPAPPVRCWPLLGPLFTASGLALGPVGGRPPGARGVAFFPRGAFLLAFQPTASIMFSNDVYLY